jgi:hypothetical protein
MMRRALSGLEYAVGRCSLRMVNHKALLGEHGEGGAERREAVVEREQQ